VFALCRPFGTRLINLANPALTCRLQFVPSPFDKLRAALRDCLVAAFEFDLFQAETYGLNRVCAVGKETAGLSTALPRISCRDPWR
jgi:hypothetical protein